jgi:hypothetical protein
MAKQRVQVADLPGPVAVTPKAEQVNVFHNPLTPLPKESNAALELAQGLAVLRPSLYQAADIAVDKETKEGEAQALLAERTKNRDGITSAVKAGAIPAGASPWFQKGWNRQKNRILADQYATDLQEAYAQWGDRDSEKGDLQTFMQEHLKTFLDLRQVDQSDPEFTNVFTPMAAQIQERQNAEYGAHRVNLIEKQVIENTGAEVSSILDLPYLYGGAENQAKVISATLAEHVKNGADGSTMNKVAVDAITQKAIEEGNLSLLDHLDLVDTGNGRLGRTLYAKEARDRAETHIIAEQNRQTSQGFANLEREKSLKSDQIYADWVEKLQADPTLDPRPYEQQLAKLDPNAVPHIRQYQEALLKPKVYEKSDVVANIYKDLSEGNLSNEEIVAHAAAGDIDPGTVANLFKEKNILEKSHSALSDPTFKQVSGGMVRKMTGDPLKFDLQKTEKAEIARYRMSVGWAAWSAKNHDADEVTKLKFLNSLSQEMELAYNNGKLQEPEPAEKKDFDLSSLQGIREALDDANAADDKSETFLGQKAEAAGLTIEEYIQALSAAAKKRGKQSK